MRKAKIPTSAVMCGRGQVAGAIRSLHVLHLFAQLLDQHLHVDGEASSPSSTRRISSRWASTVSSSSASLVCSRVRRRSRSSGARVRAVVVGGGAQGCYRRAGGVEEPGSRLAGYRCVRRLLKLGEVARRIEHAEHHHCDEGAQQHEQDKCYR